MPHDSQVDRSALVRRAVALLLGIHGLIHVIGFAVPWRLAIIEGSPFGTTVAWGMADVGEGGARLLGVAWLVVGAAFVVAAEMVWRRSPTWTATVLVTSVASLGVCILGSPAAIAGVVVDLAVLGWLAFAARPVRSAAVAI